MVEVQQTIAHGPCCIHCCLALWSPVPTSKPSQYSLQQLTLPPVLHAVNRKDASALSSGAAGSLKRRN
jgi:hypothetical protein